MSTRHRILLHSSFHLKCYSIVKSSSVHLSKGGGFAVRSQVILLCSVLGGRSTCAPVETQDNVVSEPSFQVCTEALSTRRGLPPLQPISERYSEWTYFLKAPGDMYRKNMKDTKLEADEVKRPAVERPMGLLSCSFQPRSETLNA